MSAKRKATAIMQHHKENISAPEPSEITEDDHYSSTLMKDAEKLKLMLLAWNYRNFSMQQQQQQQPSPVVSSVPGQLPATGAGQITTQQVVQQPTSVVQQQQQTQQQQQQQQQQPPVSTNTVSAAINCSALSPSASNNGSAVATTNTTTSLPTVTSGQAACTTTNGSVVNAINNTISSVVSGGGGITESRNGKDLEMPELISVTGAAAASVAGATSEDMASLWASYTMSLKKTPSPGSNTPSRERDRDSSPVGEAGSAHDETSSSGNKEDEDDDDEDVDERLDPRHHDPERLKAFNMFVRLFVDENLDRIVPISKQPKEKIQAIIDSCTRQFPEFAERARKRIRTYLKSCRRNKRGREGASWDAARPTPAHLTSVQAEQILATACENESDNAKRMRVGLEPVSQPMPTLPAATQTDVRANMEHFGAGAGGAGAGGSGGVGGAGASAAAGSSSSGGNSTQVKSLSVGSIKREDTPPSTATSLTSLAPLTSLANLPNNAAAAAAVAAASLVSTGALSLAPSSKLLTNTCTSNDSKTHMSQATIVSSSTANGLGNAAAGAAPTAMYRPNFGQAFQRSGGPTVPPTLSAGLYPTQSFTSGFLSNGTTRPTDLSMKSTKPLLSHKLNATEMTAVRQLITGYRESAAFLLRSADELEQLLHQQP